MENNTAFVATLKNITKIEGADKIVRADVALKGVTVASIVTGVDTKEDTPVVYFDSNLCLSEILLKDFPDLGRYLGKGGRVKTVKLRGCISNGLVVDIDKFYGYTNKKVLEEGFSFTELGGKEMCHKYIVPVRVQNNSEKKGRKGKVLSRMLPGMFHFHVDTEQLLRNAFKVNPESVVSLSTKIHGTSFIASRCLVLKKMGVLETFLYKLYTWSNT